MFVSKALALTLILVTFNYFFVESKQIYNTITRALQKKTRQRICPYIAECLNGERWDQNTCNCVATTTIKSKRTPQTTTRKRICPYIASCLNGEEWDQNTCNCV